MVEPQGVQVLKCDAFGRVELLASGGERFVRRIACGGRIPGSRLVARVLAGRERRALQALAGLDAVPGLVVDDLLSGVRDADGLAPRAGDVLIRTWIEGAPLHRAERLPADFFDLLDALVAEVHARGVCHNDLHKEQNIVVDESGRPALIDFQLASVHAGDSFVRRARIRDDLRHLMKHRRRYTRDGRGPVEVGDGGSGRGIRRSPAALVWRRLAKPVYVWITRGILRTRDGEERRPSSGPWPEWGPPVGARSSGEPLERGGPTPMVTPR